jgi:conjugal transfer pilus assembly protein TraU
LRRQRKRRTCLQWQVRQSDHRRLLVVPLSPLGGRPQDLAERPARYQQSRLAGLRLRGSVAAHRHCRRFLGAGSPGRCDDEAVVLSQPGRYPHRPGFDIGQGYLAGPSMVGGRSQSTAKWHVHWYVYPLLYWMEILTDFVCFEQASFDIAYMTEIDPLWQDDALTTLINPEAIIFANPIAQAACAGDCIAGTVNLPLDPLFWCAGCQGSMYPLNGNVPASIGHVQSSRLAVSRFAYKMHREALAWGTMGSKGLCKKYLMPIMRKQQYRFQMVNPIPTVSGRFACSAIGASTMPPDAGRAYPAGGEDMGYLVWRKRNCCVL